MKKAVNKVAFYLIYFHNKIHLAIFNIFIPAGAFLITRVLIHMKTVPENDYQKIDKTIGLVCLVLLVWDFKELFESTTIAPKIHMTQIQIQTESAKLEAAKLNLKERVEKIQEIKNEPVKKNSRKIQNKKKEQVLLLTE